MFRHQPLWLTDWLEAKLCIQAVSIASPQGKRSKSLEIGMRKNRSHQGFRDPATTKLRNDKYVGEVGKHCAVRDDASECDLQTG